MSSRRAGQTSLLLLCTVLGCKEKPVPTAAASASAARAMTPAEAPATSPAVSAEVAPNDTSGREGPKAPTSLYIVQHTKLAKLGTESDGRFVGELARTPPARAWLTIASKESPLLPRARNAHFRIAELLAPGVVAPTALRVFTVEDLSQPANAAARAKLKSTTRVLANGTVEVAVTLTPATGLDRIDLGDLVEGRPVHKWEQRLSARDPIPEEEKLSLSLYQQLCAADYVAGNLVRRHVHVHPKSGRLTAAEENEAFSVRGKDGAVGDGFERLSRHVVFSKGLEQRLAKLERAELECALNWGDPPSLLTTPKQVEEALDRAKTVHKLIESRKKSRGEAAVLVLP